MPTTGREKSEGPQSSSKGSYTEKGSGRSSERGRVREVAGGTIELTQALTGQQFPPQAPDHIFDNSVGFPI